MDNLPIVYKSYCTGFYALRHNHATNLDGSPKFIEVKTTKGGIRTGFYITPNELAFSELNSDSYVLIRVFDFDLEKETGKYFELGSDLKTHVSLTPVNFKATF